MPKHTTAAEDSQIKDASDSPTDDSGEHIDRLISIIERLDDALEEARNEIESLNRDVKAKDEEIQTLERNKESP